jgi:hypothetical protein
MMGEHGVQVAPHLLKELPINRPAVSAFRVDRTLSRHRRKNESDPEPTYVPLDFRSAASP